MRTTTIKSPSLSRGTPNRVSAAPEHPAHEAHTLPLAAAPLSSRSSSRADEKDIGLELLLKEVAELKDENDKLRQIEEQFWLVLYEKEDLQRELEARRGGQGLPSPNRARDPQSQHPMNSGAVAGSSSSSGGGSAAVASTALAQAEYDAMSTALEECFELLMDPPTRKTLEQSELGNRGSVRAFLAWLQLSHDRAVALQSLASARDDGPGTTIAGAGGNGVLSPRMSKAVGAFSSTYALGGISREEKESLLRELHQTKQEVRQLQEELDRTDLSRLQALEDAERMQQQIEVLSKGVQELRQAYNAVKTQAESSAKHAQQVQQLKVQLAQRDATIHELKSKVSQLQRLGDVGSAELAADAARIRQQLAARSGSNGGTAQDVMLSP